MMSPSTLGLDQPQMSFTKIILCVGVDKVSQHKKVKILEVEIQNIIFDLQVIGDYVR